jgi:V/A-type H+-transporting ATPase subunit E
MNQETQLEHLENAILKRAQTLANAQLHAAQQQREQILTHCTKHLQQQEAQETELAKTLAERAYRCQVQASEIKMQAELDQLRWHLVQTVITHLYAHLKQLRQQKTAYLALLAQDLTQAAQAFDELDLIVEVNAQDYEQLQTQWESWYPTILSDKKCTLTASTQPFIGGVVVYDCDRQRRFNNTFEGKITRLENELHQIITAQLFASTTAIRHT